MNVYSDYTKNGVHTPLLGLIALGATGSVFASTAITLKMFQENYHYWFYHHFYTPQGYTYRINYYKQFIHYTDTGHIISFLCLVEPSWIPIAFNTHFTISIAYWIHRVFLGLADDDGDFTSLPPEERPWSKWTNWWWTMNHSLPLTILSWMIFTNTITPHPSSFPTPMFNTQTLLASFGWMYGWVIFIYIPWRAITNDAVYSILRWETPMWKITSSVIIIHLTLFLGNTTGSLLSNPPGH